MALRLYDRLQTSSGGVLSQQYIDQAREELAAMKDSPVVVLDNVTRYLYEISGRDGWRKGTDLPPVFPPFERAFLETRAPQQMLDSRGRNIYEHASGEEPPPGVPASRWANGIGDAIPEQWGFHVHCKDLKRELGQSYPDEASSQINAYLRENGVPSFMRRRATFSPVRWLLTATYYIEGAAWARSLLAGNEAASKQGSDHPVGPIARVFIGLDEDGELVRYSGSEDRMRLSMALIENDGKGSSSNSLGEVLATNALGLFSPMLLCMALMNCQNVPVERESPTAATSHQEATRNGGRKPASYYVLGLKPMEELLEREGKASKVGIGRAFHLCRGHLRIYTPEGGGPFGRAIDEPVAQYVSPHTRGNRSEGEISKDYRIEEPYKEPVFKTPPNAPGQPSPGMVRTRTERPSWARSAKQEAGRQTEAPESNEESPAADEFSENSSAEDTASHSTSSQTHERSDGLKDKLGRALRRFRKDGADSEGDK